jgi:hypothetical protein
MDILFSGAEPGAFSHGFSGEMGKSMTEHEWFLAGMVCLGVALGMVLAWLSTRRAKGFRKRFLDEMAEAGGREGGVEQRFREILNDRRGWKRSHSLIRKPFSKHVNMAIETAAMIYALTGLVNTMVHFERYFDSPGQAYGTLAFLSLVIGFIPAENMISSRVDKEMDSILDDMEEALTLKRTSGFLDRVGREWQ